jgi:hypothetical protein
MLMSQKGFPMGFSRAPVVAVTVVEAVPITIIRITTTVSFPPQQPSMSATMLVAVVTAAVPWLLVVEASI